MTDTKNDEGNKEKQGSKLDDSSSAWDSGAIHLENLANTFSASARRWEMVVYPSLFAFVILAAYGFYLIYSLTSDAHEMTKSMKQMTVEMQTMSRNMVVMTQLMDNQSKSMNDMAINMRSMQFSMAQMRYDFSIMNQNVSRPMSFMNSFMPW